MDRRGFLGRCVAVASGVAGCLWQKPTAATVPVDSGVSLITERRSANNSRPHGYVNDYFNVGPHVVQRQRIYADGVLARERYWCDDIALNNYAYAREGGTTFRGEMRFYDRNATRDVQVMIDPPNGIFLIVHRINSLPPVFPVRTDREISILAYRNWDQSWRVVDIHTGIQRLTGPPASA